MLEEITRLSEDFQVSKDETKILLLKTIEQSIRDYNNLRKSVIPIEQQYFATAECFLFEKDYEIHWGDIDITLEDILNYLHIESEWFYKKLYTLVKE